MRSLLPAERLVEDVRPLAQFVRFACVGVSNTLVSYVVYAALVFAGVSYLPAGGLAFVAGAVNGYRLNRRWTFRAAASAARRLRYLVVQAGSLGATTALLWLVVSVGGVHRLAGYVVTIPVVTVASFVVNRVWTFALPEESQPGRRDLRALGGLLRGNRRKESTMSHLRRISNGDPWRILVVANETVASSVLHEAIELRAEDVSAQVLVVAPALNGRLQHWLSDHDGARSAAEERLRGCLAQLAAAGIDANGQVGDSDPLLAIADALRLFAADEIIIATHPEERSNWLARHLVARARTRFHQPILHVVVETADSSAWPAALEGGSTVATAA